MPNKTQTTDRQTGRTTRQLTDAPYRAIYICHNIGNIDYTRSLAAKLGRLDIRFDTPTFFKSGRYRGLKKSQIVIDHATPYLMPHEDRYRMDDVLDQMHD